MKTAIRIAGACLALVLAGASVSNAQAEQERRYDYATGEWVNVDPQTARGRHMLRNRQPAARYDRTRVGIRTEAAPGTVIIDSRKRLLYLVGRDDTALRYGVGVGRQGFAWSGRMRVGRKAEWPGWTPPAAMRRREAAKGRQLPRYMEGGPNNPLGARALYLYRGGHDSMFRIHGTNQPWTIGRRVSSGCIRMMNKDVKDLYSRVPRGARVVVIGPNGEGPDAIYRDLGPTGGLASIFG